MQSTGENFASVIPVLWVNVASIISDFYSFGNYQTTMGTSFSSYVGRNPVRGILEDTSYCCPGSCRLNDFAALPINSTMQQTILIEGFIKCAVHLYSLGLKVTQGQDSVKHGMYSMHDAYITPLWPYGGKTAGLLRCGFGLFFSGAKVYESLCHTLHAPAQSSSWELRRCVGCPGAMHRGEPHAVWMFPCQKACM